MSTLIQVLLGGTLGLVLICGALPKLRHPRGFVLTVLEYRVLPPVLGRLYARAVPPLELLGGLLFLSGIGLRSASALASLLLLSYMIGVGVNVARGRDLDCHCFGRAKGRRIGPALLFQNTGLLAASLVLAALAGAWLTPEPWSIFALSGLADTASVAPFLLCVAVTAGAATWLGSPGRASASRDSLGEWASGRWRGVLHRLRGRSV